MLALVMLVRCALILAEAFFFGTVFTALVMGAKHLVERRYNVKAYKAWKAELDRMVQEKDALLIAGNDISPDALWSVEEMATRYTAIDAHHAKRPAIPRWMFWVK